MTGRIASRTDRPDGTQIVIRPYTDADESATLDVLTASLGAGPAGARTPEFFRWKHLDSPFGRSFILLALAGEQIVGVRALMRWRFESGDSSVPAVRAVDTATHPDWQGQGLFTRLTLEAIDRLRLDTDFIFNTPNEKSLPGYLKMGWQIVEKVPVAIRVRRPLRFGRRMRTLNGPTPAGVSLPRTDAPPAAQALETKGIEELLRVRAEEGGLSTPRDVPYLRWRYGSAPLLDYRAVVDERGGTPNGLAIFRVRARGALRESTICELVVGRNDARSARRLLRAVAGAASVDHVTLHPRDSVEASAARRSGFLPSPGGVTFVVNPLRERVRSIRGSPRHGLFRSAIWRSSSALCGGRHMSMTTLVRKSTKAAALPLSWPVGKRAGAAVVLLYHKIGAGDREIDIPTDVFVSQLRHISRFGRPGTLEEVMARGGVAVTIDDGYIDFYDNVLPAAVESRVPVLLYLATGLVAAGGKRSSDALSWSQLAESLSTGLVEIGADTHSHANLGRAGSIEAETEMRRSKELIEDRLGVACRHFAYPWSVASSDAEVIARSLFHTSALRWGTNRVGSIDPHRVGRTPVLKSDGNFFFKAKLAGRLDGEALVYRSALRRGPWRAA